MITKGNQLVNVN